MSTDKTTLISFKSVRQMIEFFERLLCQNFNCEHNHVDTALKFEDQFTLCTLNLDEKCNKKVDTERY